MREAWLGLLCWASVIVGANADSGPIPIEPISGSIAPYVDKDGYVNPIIDLGKIEFGDGLVLPLVLNFSSAVRPPSPEFGQGWECPLFEAKVFDYQKNIKQLETLGGKSRYLLYNARTDTWSHIYTDDWQGVTKGNDFELTYKKSGAKFVFSKGLISSINLPDGRTILWNRMGDKLVSIQENGKSPALQITYDKFGFASQILLNPDNPAKASYNLTPSLIYGGIQKIEGPGKRVITFDRSHDDKLNQIVSWKDSLHTPVNLTWDGKTGKILKDDVYSYTISEVEKSNTWPRMVRKNIKNGHLESYYFDEKRGTTDEVLPNGTTRHVEIVQSPGPNYKDTRLIQDTVQGKVQPVLRRAFDDQGHLILEAIGVGGGKEQVKRYTYDEAGRVVSYVFNGKEMWKNIYDPATGFLKERDLENLGMKLTFDQGSNGQIKEVVEKAGGEVTAAKTLSAPQWQAVVASMQRVN